MNELTPYTPLTLDAVLDQTPGARSVAMALKRIATKTILNTKIAPPAVEVTPPDTQIAPSPELEFKLLTDESEPYPQVVLGIKLNADPATRKRILDEITDELSELTQWFRRRHRAKLESLITISVEPIDSNN